MKRGAPISAVLSSPTAVAVDAAENVYVTESVKNRLLVYGPGGEYMRKLDGLAKPAGVAVDDLGRIYVCSMGRKSVEVYDAGFRRLRALGSGSGEFELPVGIATGIGGRIYVADAKANVVKVYLPDGAFSFAFGGPGNGDGLFNFPTSIASDPGSGDIAVSDLQLSPGGVKGARVQLFDADGRFKRAIGGYGQGNGLLMKPLGTAIDGGGRIYVSDANQNIVHVYDGDGRYQATVYDRDRPLRTPLGIAVSRRTGRLYVASLNTSTVETYGDGAAAGGENPPGNGSLSFSTSSGGACSMVGAPNRTSPWGFLAPLTCLVLWLLARRLASRKKRSGVPGGR